MKRILTILLFIFLIMQMAGCKQVDAGSAGKISIVCTVFPQYDWTRQILGEKADDVNLKLLLNNSADLHNYQLTVDDIVQITTCDMFIYIGGESDKWVDDALRQAANPDMIAINLLGILGDTAKIEEILEGMEADHGYGDDDDEDEVDLADGNEAEYDEHVWLSLKNAKVFCEVIAGALSSLDTDNAKQYEENLTSYSARLSALDMEYRRAVDASSVRTLLFGDRFPFRYLVDDYEMTAYAAFPGCSAETEASFNTIILLAKKVDELELRTVMVTESADQSIARTIIGNTAAKNQQILVLDSIQSISANDIENGATYLSIMEYNLDVLKKALS